MHQTVNEMSWLLAYAKNTMTENADMAIYKIGRSLKFVKTVALNLSCFHQESSLPAVMPVWLTATDADRELTEDAKGFGKCIKSRSLNTKKCIRLKMDCATSVVKNKLVGELKLINFALITTTRLETFVDFSARTAIWGLETFKTKLNYYKKPLSI